MALFSKSTSRLYRAKRRSQAGNISRTSGHWRGVVPAAALVTLLVLAPGGGVGAATLSHVQLPIVARAISVRHFLMSLYLHGTTIIHRN